MGSWSDPPGKLFQSPPGEEVWPGGFWTEQGKGAGWGQSMLYLVFSPASKLLDVPGLLLRDEFWTFAGEMRGSYPTA